MKDRLYLCAVLSSIPIVGSEHIHWIDPVVASAKEHFLVANIACTIMRTPSNLGCRLHASPIPQCQMRISNATPVGHELKIFMFLAHACLSVQVSRLYHPERPEPTEHSVADCERTLSGEFSV